MTNKQREQTIGHAIYEVMQHAEAGTWSIVKIEFFFYEVRGGFTSRAAAFDYARKHGLPVGGEHATA